jgi:putative spermidine/putrescine transport system permease protein
MGRLRRDGWKNILAAFYVGLIAIFILLPIIIVIVMSFNKGQYFAFPPRELSVRWYTEAVTRAEWRRAFVTSLWIAIVVAGLATVVGILAGLALYRGRFRGREALVSFFLSPLILPQLLLGLALLFFLARLRLIGSPFALLLGHVLVTFPYVLRIILSALAGVPPSVEEAAMTMGADELVTTISVTLPIIRPAVTSGAVFAFILSFDNIMISLFVASARTITLPVKILQTIEETTDPTIAAISSVFIVLSVGLLVLVERTTGLQFFEEVGTQ